MPRVGYGDRIRLLRRDLGMTGEQFAATINAKPATLSRHETMHDSPLRNTYALANSIELRYGHKWPGGLAHWILTGHEPGSGKCNECAARDSNPEPAGKGPRVLPFPSRLVA